MKLSDLKRTNNTKYINITQMNDIDLTDELSVVTPKVTNQIIQNSELNAEQITTGTIDIDRLPAGALERLHIVTNQTARFTLTTNDVQNGDTVKETDTGLMYFVVDQTKLNSADGYEVYTSGSATSVPWSGVSGKPSTFAPSSHNNTAHSTNYAAEAITISAGTGLTGGGDLTSNRTLNVSYGTAAGTACQGNDLRLSDSRPASDVSAWAKQASLQASAVPNLDASKITTGTIGIDRLPEISGGLKPIFVSSNYTIKKDEMVFVDTTTSSITITLPASPVNGDVFKVVDGKKNSETNNIIVARNGNTIDNKSEDLIINYNGYGLLFVYDNGNYHIIDNLYHY